MCRLAIIAGIEKPEPIATALAQLEKSMGGDGNGVWNSVKGEILKGVTLGTEEIAEEIAGLPGYNIFHTRMSTAGGVRSEINHPFDAGDWVLAHNGHWSGWFSYAEGTISDTQTAAAIVKEHGPGVLLNREFDHSGVWVVGSPEGAFVLHRGWNNFYLQPLKKGGVFHASEGIQNFARKGVYMVPKNSIHWVTEDNVFETELKATPMPTPVYDLDTMGYGGRSFGSYSTGSSYSSGRSYGRGRSELADNWSGVYSYDDTFDFDEAEWDRFERELVEGNVTSWREYVEIRKFEEEAIKAIEEDGTEAGAYEDDEFGPRTNFLAGSEDENESVLPGM